MSEEIVTYGQIAYEAYRSHTNGKSIATGDSIPVWDDLDERIQAAWMVAGVAVMDQALEDGVAITPTGYQGAAAHTFTTGCDGFHPIGEQCNLPAAPEPAAAMAETTKIRELVQDILGTFGSPSGDGYRARVGAMQIRKWRDRAGLNGALPDEQPQTAVTEHLVAQLAESGNADGPHA